MAYINDWQLFVIFFGLMLFVTFLMMKQSQLFVTKDPIVRKFSIMELEVPASPKELVNLIKGLYALSGHESDKSIRALKSQLKLDFLFMPLAYGSIFLLCWRVAHKMEISFGRDVFIALAFLQLAPWVCDIIENSYLLGKITPDINNVDEKKLNENPVEKKKHKQYLLMEAAKWGIALTGTVCSISATCYFWLTGKYSDSSLKYLSIVFLETVAFIVAMAFTAKKNKSIPS